MTCASVADHHSPWCCRHKWTLRYLTSVVTIELVLQLLQIRGVL